LIVPGGDRTALLFQPVAGVTAHALGRYFGKSGKYRFQIAGHTRILRGNRKPGVARAPRANASGCERHASESFTSSKPKVAMTRSSSTLQRRRGRPSSD
jgi:hypothetical protein